MVVLSAKNIVLAYSNKIILDNISFDVNLRDYICIVGENGSGKSSLIKGILGLTRIKSGNFVFAQDIKTTEIGYLPQQTNIQKDFTASVYEVIISGCLNKMKFMPFYSKKQKDIANKSITMLNIKNIKHCSYRDLSGGQQQRVLLARAICATKKLLILDEPVSGLDPIITAEFYSITKMLNEEYGITIIMVSHDINTAVSHANKILYLGKELLFFGKTSDYLSSNLSNKFTGRI